jgi:hypothetical protein
MIAVLTKLRKWGARWCQPVAAAVGHCWPGFGRISAVFSLLALVSLIFLAGQATMYFGLPSSAFASKAFTGAEDWFWKVDAGAQRPEGLPPQAAVTVTAQKEPAMDTPSLR